MALIVSVNGQDVPESPWGRKQRGNRQPTAFDLDRLFDGQFSGFSNAGDGLIAEIEYRADCQGCGVKMVANSAERGVDGDARQCEGIRIAHLEASRDLNGDANMGFSTGGGH